MSSSDEMYKHITQKQNEILGRQYCSSCNSMMPPEGGRIYKIKPRRWICKGCAARMDARNK